MGLRNALVVALLGSLVGTGAAIAAIGQCCIFDYNECVGCKKTGAEESIMLWGNAMVCEPVKGMNCDEPQNKVCYRCDDTDPMAEPCTEYSDDHCGTLANFASIYSNAVDQCEGPDYCD